MKLFEAQKWDGEMLMIPPSSVTHFEEVAPSGIPQFPGALSTLIYNLGVGPTYVPLKEDVRYLEAIVLRGERGALFLKATFPQGNKLYTLKTAVVGVEGIKGNTLPDKPGEEVKPTGRTKLTLQLDKQVISTFVMEEASYIQEQVGYELEERPALPED